MLDLMFENSASNVQHSNLTCVAIVCQDPGQQHRGVVFGIGGLRFINFVHNL